MQRIRSNNAGLVLLTQSLGDFPKDLLQTISGSVGCNGRSMADIAAEVGLSRTSVRRALVEAGIPVDDRRLPPELDDPDWLAAQQGVTGRDLARRLDVTPEAVSRARQRHGLLAGVRRSPKFPQLDDRAWLEHRYHSLGMTQAQVAAEVGCSRWAVALAMDRLGIEARPNKVPEYPLLHDRDWLAAQVAAGRTPRVIADELGCHRTSVAAALRDVLGDGDGLDERSTTTRT